MTDHHPIFKATVAEVDTATDTGSFTAVVAVFGNVDKAGDRLMPGAFTNTIARWRVSGKNLPIIFSHAWDDPAALVGYADPHDLHETDAGLVLTATFLDSPDAQAVREMMAKRAITEFSFGYRVVRERKASDGALDLLEVDLIEAGPCLQGVNPETQLLAVKGATPATAELERINRQLDAELAELDGEEPGAGLVYRGPSPQELEVLAKGLPHPEPPSKLSRLLASGLTAEEAEVATAAHLDGRDPAEALEALAHAKALQVSKAEAQRLADDAFRLRVRASELAVRTGKVQPVALGPNGRVIRSQAVLDADQAEEARARAKMEAAAAERAAERAHLEAAARARQASAKPASVLGLKPGQVEL